MIDTHCHLNLEPLREDISLAVGQAAARGVDRIIVPSVSVDSSKLSVEVCKRFPSVYAAVGIHPLEEGVGEVSVIEELLREEPSIVAVGEIGFDFSSDSKNYEVQYSRFQEQLTLAQKYDKPVIIHSRDAYRETAEMLRNEGFSRAVIHCFTGTYPEVVALLDLGCLISVTGIITYPSALALREIIARIPLDRLMLETDAPYLAPQTRRGRSNKPEYLVEIAQALADIHGVTLQVVDSITTATAEQFFALPHG